MRQAVLDATRDADMLIMAAAASDFRPSDVGEQKIKRPTGKAAWSCSLSKTRTFSTKYPTASSRWRFAAETENVVENAKRKPRTHGHLDLICANDVSATDAGFAHRHEPRVDH